MINKIKTHTHLEVKNSWTPLDKEEGEEEGHQLDSIHKIKETTIKSKPRNRPEGRQRSVTTKKKSLKLVIDSGATSHFICEEANLPTTGKMNTLIYLPDDTKLKATTKAQLPIPKLSNKAKGAIVVPGLKQNLSSINKFSQAGYTTVFQRGNNPQAEHFPNHNNHATHSPRVQKQRTMDGDSRQHRTSGTTTKSE